MRSFVTRIGGARIAACAALLALGACAGRHGALPSADLPTGAQPAALSPTAMHPGAASDPIAIAPSPLVFEALGTANTRRVSVTEKGYRGRFVLRNGCGKRIHVTPASAAGPKATFAIVPLQTGTCNVAFADAHGHSAVLTIATVVVSAYTLPFWGWGLTAGPNGELWADGSSSSGAVVAAIATDGSVANSFAIPASYGWGDWMTSGPDGNLWIPTFTTTAPNCGVMLAMTPAGQFNAYPVTTPSTSCVAGENGIAVGSDGALWFAQCVPNAIGRMTTGGALTEFPLTGSASPFNVTAGPDGAMWFTRPYAGAIGRITTGGAIAQFPVTRSGGGIGALGGIVAGPDRALWFTEPDADKIGRITTTGSLRTFALPKGLSPDMIVAGPDRALWFTSARGIGRITLRGAVVVYPLPSLKYGTSKIVVGPDRALWFTAWNSSGFPTILGRIQP